MMKIVGYKTEDFFIAVERKIKACLDDSFGEEREKEIFDFCSEINKYVIIFERTELDEIMHFCLISDMHALTDDEKIKINIKNIKDKNYRI